MLHLLYDFTCVCVSQYVHELHIALLIDLICFHMLAGIHWLLLRFLYTHNPSRHLLIWTWGSTIPDSQLLNQDLGAEIGCRDTSERISQSAQQERLSEKGFPECRPAHRTTGLNTIGLWKGFPEGRTAEPSNKAIKNRNIQKDSKF